MQRIAAILTGLLLLGCASTTQQRAETGSEPRPGVRAPVFTGNICPLCDGELTNVGSVPDDPSRPSRNLAVWNRSICANLFFGSDSVICTQCWHAWSKLMNRWERSSELPDSFYRPLAASIRQCPLPPAPDIKSRVVYSQNFDGAAWRESVAFWSIDSPELIHRCQAWADGHDLKMQVDSRDRIPKQVFVMVETP